MGRFSGNCRRSALQGKQRGPLWCLESQNTRMYRFHTEPELSTFPIQSNVRENVQICSSLVWNDFLHLRNNLFLLVGDHGHTVSIETVCIVMQAPVLSSLHANCLVVHQPAQDI